MNSHKNLQEIEMLQIFFKKNHKAYLSSHHSKIEITSCDVSKLLVDGKNLFSSDTVKIYGPVMHSRFQPLWLAILLDLNVRLETDSDEWYYKFAIMDLIEKSERVCQAIGLRAIRYSHSDISYFIMHLIEFRLEIILKNCIQTIPLFSEVGHELEARAMSIGSVVINPRAASKLHALSNKTTIVLTILFFSKRTALYTLMQKLLLKKEGLTLADIAPATVSDIKFLSHHGLLTYTKVKKIINIHRVSVFLEGLTPL
ncbi:hypothetical protein [Klebsiella grimontii]|uniref:hypothetical protein n=1 Tax=Klebsiella grimontii TaxID=2058152 RepID=UPI0012B8354D|nr:hypothetical protein [Klebsiella grimontii]